jgi:chitodextrinase
MHAATAACAAPPPSPDTTPPSTPSGLAASNVTASGLSLSWNASTDNTGVTGYDVYRNGTKVASGSSTSATQTGLTCGTAYAFGVVARDAAGNSSPTAQLNAATAACAAPPPAPDTTPPSQPSNFRITGATATSIDLGWNGSTDNVGVAGYRIYRNGVAGATTTQTSTTVSGLTCGTAYTFEVDAYDAAGNRSPKSTMVGSTSACADTQAPSAPGNVSASSRTASSIALGWSASTDNVGVVGYGLYRNGTQLGTSTTPSGIFSGLACNTNYTLAVDAYDAAGNRSGKTTTMVATTACPDTTPPSTPSGLSASNVSQTGLTLNWSASTDNVGVTGYDVYRNGTKMASGTPTSSAQTGLSCGTSYSFGVVARDAAGNSSPQASLSAQTSACPAAPPPPPPPPPLPPPAGCAVDPASMTAPGCALVRSDSSATQDPLPGLWGSIEAVDASRYQYVTSGGDTQQMADGTSQGNSAYRQLTVVDGDDHWGERAELGRNWWANGENDSATKTDGAFALAHEGDRRITFWSMRFPSGFPMDVNAWQQIAQWKQAQPYTDADTATRNPDGNGVTLELQMYANQFRLCTWWQQRWATAAPPTGKWIRFATDITFSQWPNTGKVRVFVDSNADGDFLDPGEASPVWQGATLAYVTTADSGLAAGDSVPSMLAMGLYHNPSAYGTTSVELDNVQVLRP